LEFDLSSPSGPGINIKTGDLLAVNGVPLNTKICILILLKSRKTNCTFCKQFILKDAKEFTPVSSEVNLRQQDWVETNRRKVDKLSNGQAYVWLPQRWLHKFQPLLF
jgi:tricorn protease